MAVLHVTEYCSVYWVSHMTDSWSRAIVLYLLNRSVKSAYLGEQLVLLGKSSECHLEVVIWFRSSLGGHDSVQKKDDGCLVFY